MEQWRGPARQLARDLSQTEVDRTGDEDPTKTMAVRACRVCGSGLPEHDSFCRWCGARQTGDFGANRRSHIRHRSLHQVPSPDQAPSPTSRYHPVSGPLVTAIAENLEANLASQRRERFVRRVIQALVSIPIWMVFVLLSPFDAYATAKNVTKGPFEPVAGRAHVTAVTDTKRKAG